MAPVNRKQRRAQGDHRMVHKLIKEVAQSLAGAYYEHAASHGKHGNEFYKTFPNQKAFIKDQWPMFVKTTKEVLTQQLSDPATPEAYKNDIYHALLLDATLPYSPQEAQLVNFRTH